jgi:hypothetical protein
VIPYDVEMSARRAKPTPTHRRLRAVFGQILALTGGVTLACGGAVTDRDANSGTAPRSLCGTDRPAAFPSGLRASPPQDYVASRVEAAFLQGMADGGEGEEAWVSSTATPSGTPCATATNPADCNRRLAELRLLPRTREECETRFPNVTHPGGVHPGCRIGYLVFTRGDEVGTAVDDAEVSALVGAIDTVQEADWILRRTYEPTCGGPKGQDLTVRESEEGYEFVFVNNCERTSIIRTVHVARDGTVTERAPTKATPGMQFICAVAGRRPDGYVRSDTANVTKSASGKGSGAWFAEIAELEAAAVIAFRRLSRELASLGAPADLLARVREATRDEIRHTRSMRAFARRDGVEPKTPCVVALPTRDVLAIALENAREGCVRETYGALVAWHQSIHAEDAGVRAAMRVIAEDETAHAALSIDIGRWLHDRLDESERRSVAAEHAAASLALDREIEASACGVESNASFEQSVGLPTVPRARAMLAALAQMS